jgi:hypothetical protein
LIFVAAMPYEEALEKLGSRSPIGSYLSTWYWQNRVPVLLRERAFFSATIENTRFLDRAQRFLLDFLQRKTEIRHLPDGGTEVYLKAGSRAQFIEELQTFAIREGMKPLDQRDVGSIKDIRSEGRLSLIFDTNMKSAADFGYWKQGQDPDVLDAFPAQRFIRVAPVRKPRPLHQANKGEVRRKDDLRFWLRMNDPKIGGFGVPWGPWGFNSGMDVEDVGRDESDAKGLTKPNERMQPAIGELNDALQASTRGLDVKSINFLKAAFGNRAEFDGDSVSWRGN